MNVVTQNEKISSKNAYQGSEFSLQFLIEICMALIFAGLAVYAARPGFFTFLPIYAFFAAGYGLVGYFTLVEIRNNRFTSQSKMALKQ
jgi:hypothetical protein